MTLDDLLKLYIAARTKLLDTIINYKGVGTKTYYNTILLQVNAEIKRLSKATTEYANTEIPAAYQAALTEVYDYFKKTSLQMKPPTTFATLHNDTVYDIAREMQVQVNSGLEQVGRQIVRYADESRDETLRHIGLEATGEKIASATTVKDMQANLTKKLEDEGFMTVQYGSGDKARQVPLDVYTGMVARSTSREAHNSAKINQLSANDRDLVTFTKRKTTCARCAMLEDRVYSISGEDKRFPALSVAFPGPYKNIHPNCRHAITPWTEELKTPKQIEDAIKNSNREYKDDRTDERKKGYHDEQVRRRQKRQDLYQFERYQKRLGKDAPKSIGAFRRIKNADGERWKQLESAYRRAAPNSKSPAIAFMQEHGLTVNEQNAVMSYLSSDSYKVNAALRNEKHLTKAQQELVQNLDTALEKLPVYDGPVVRDMSFPYNKDASAFIDSHAIGSDQNYKQYVSSTTGESYHKKPHIRLYIESETGRNLQKVNVSEKEVLFGRNAVFRVIDKTVDAEGTQEIYLKEIT